MTIVTVFTDASYCPNSRKGGWAMWAKRKKDEQIVHSHHFKRKIKDNNVAEMMAIANSLKYLYNKGWLEPNTRVVIGTDSQTCINVFEKNSVTYKEMRQPFSVIKQIEKECKIFIVMRHVKGHISLSKRNARNHVNNTVDLLSHRAMKRARGMRL